MIRQAPGAAAPRHAERVQDETFVPLSGRLTMYLGEPLLGPLYHLTERQQRVQALAEARRVLRVGGVAVAVAISRYASLIDGTVSGVPGRLALRRNRGARPS